MKITKETATAAQPGSTRWVSFCLYVLTAIAFATTMFLIGLIPGNEGGGRAIRYQSFGFYSLFLIIIFLFDAGRPLSGLYYLLPSTPYAAPFFVGVLYSLLIVLPIYFYLRTRRSWLLALQLVFLCAHAAFALFVVAPFWIHQ